MSRRPDLHPLPSDVQSLLERTRPGVEPSPAVRAELRARLGSALSLPLPTAPATPPHWRLAHRAAGLLSKKAPLALLSFGLGAGTGATVAVRALRAQSDAVVRAQPVVPAVAPFPLPAPIEAPLPAVPPAPAETAPPEPHPRVQPARSPARLTPVVSPGPAVAPPVAEIGAEPDRLLAAERVLIEKGRSALARGDAAGALAAVDEHDRTFPRGSLREERDALRVQALVTAGRKAEAADALADFARRYPRSMLTPALHRALQ